MIAIIDYNIGNTGSIVNALNNLNVQNVISGSPLVLRKADALVLPGVGNAAEGMRNLKKKNLDKTILSEIASGKPFLGVCLGMQLLFEKSEEGNVTCLGVFEGTVKKFQKEKKIPQIGWNSISFSKTKNLAGDLLDKIPDNSYFYFVNSYYCSPSDTRITVAESEYGESFASIVARESVVGVQFHPEKSGDVGYTFLKNFFKTYAN